MSPSSSSPLWYVWGPVHPAIGPTLGAKFGLLWVYHSIQEEWLMLWAYGGGQKTQQNCFGYNMVVSFIVSSVSATHVKANKHHNKVSQ